VIVVVTKKKKKALAEAAELEEDLDEDLLFDESKEKNE
jgi:DNA-binding MarR family transcriptional regulator